MKNLFALLFFGLLLAAISCEKDQEYNDLQDKTTTAVQQDNTLMNGQTFTLEDPKATKHKPYTRNSFNSRQEECENPMVPDEIRVTLKPGESIDEIKTVQCLPPIPPVADILYSFDLTGSMYQELGEVKDACDDIIDVLDDAIKDLRSGVISHMDYPDSYEFCDYDDDYGYGYAGDYAFKVDEDLTEFMADVHNAIGALSTASGGDYPEDYARVLWETYQTTLSTDFGHTWRMDAEKYVVAFLDAVPHDCYLVLPPPYDTYWPDGTGVDPGRDGIIGTPDDPDIDDVLAQMKAFGLHLIVIYSGDTDVFPLWEAYAANPSNDVTVFQIGTDGTIPGELDIAQLLIKAIEDATPTEREVTLELENLAYDQWVTIDDTHYPAESFFDVTFEVPMGTRGGEYHFRLVLKGDGVPYDYQDVYITVVELVPVDIKPTSCLNPINLKSGGVVSVAINGWTRFDVRRIDPSTVTLLGVSPMRHSYEDVSAPYWPFIGKVGAFDCTTEGPDGYMDLVFKFNKKDLIEAIGDAISDVLVLPLDGFMFSGIPIYGEDVVQVVNKSKT